jgi:anti-sigma B factor antagonist
MEINDTKKDGVLIVNLKGRLDYASSTTLKERILELVQCGDRQMIVNMAQVDFINSSGLGTLVSILKEVRLAKGRLVLADLATYVQEIFEITQLSHIFEIFAGEKEALESILGAPTRAGQVV